MQYPPTDRGNEERLTLPPATPSVGNSNRMTPNMSSHRTGASGQGQAAVPTSPYSLNGFALGCIVIMVQAR